MLSENSEKKKSTRRKKKVHAKPDGFQEFEELAKEILEGQGISYFYLLHEKHQEIILDFTLSNKKEIAELAKEDVNG